MTALRRALDGWNRFWFEPTSTAPLALFRSAFGVVLLGWTAAIAADARTFFGPAGLAPDRTPPPWRTGLLDLIGSDAAVVAVVAALLIAAVALIVGWHSRLAAVVAFLGLLALQRRNVWVMNSGDLLVRNLAFLLALAPSGAALSLDRWRGLPPGERTTRRFLDHPRRAVWPLRLVQLHLVLGYLFAVWGKARGTTWNEGTAIGYALRIDDLVRFPVAEALLDAVLMVNLLTYATLAVELALVVAVWNRRLRPWVLGAGAAMHLGIDLTLQVGFFSYAILVAYLAFLPPEVADRLVARAWRMAPAGSVDREAVTAARSAGAADVVRSEVPTGR